jgi:hypothetical protein
MEFGLPEVKKYREDNMELFPREELKTLVKRREGPCISIYMPTHRAFPETKQDPIRFKNLLREAEDRLKGAGLRSPEARRLLKSAKTLINDGLFWQHQADGLAAFISSDGFYRYRLPLKFDELLVVTDRFHIKPLLHLLTNDGRFYILALSQNEVRLFQCSRYSIREVELEDVPRSLSEALKYEDPQKQLQFHTQTPGGTGKRAAMFHGHGVGKDDTKDNILRFFHQVDHGLQKILREERAPLLLAGVDYLLSIYQEANSYSHVMEEGIAGNPEGLKPEELQKEAWSLVESYFLKVQQEATAQYRQLAGGDWASNEIEKIIPAARDGRVDLLFVAVGVQQWGTFDPVTFSIHLHEEPGPGDEDLLDFAALHTLLNGGTVYAVKPAEVPGQGPLAAVFRY